MAQSTAGIKLYYGDSTVTNAVPAVPTVWTEVPDITGIPAMNSAPAKLETTNIAERVSKTYIAGLADLGGSFEFPANFTPELITAVNASRVAAGSGKTRGWSVVFPAPISTRYWWTGAAEPVRPGEASVDAVASTTLYISQATSVQEVATS